jgi:hypothetical protein
MNVPVFDEIEVDAEGSAYVLREITINGRRSTSSLHLGWPAPERLRVVELLKAMDGSDTEARQSILKGHDEGNETVVEFAAFHLEEVGNEIAAKFGSQTIDARALLSNLDLRGVSIRGCPNEEGVEVVIDYSIDRNFTDGVLAVKFDANGSIVSIDHES